MIIEVYDDKKDNLIELIYKYWLSLRSTKLKYLLKGRNASLDQFLEIAHGGIDVEDMYGYGYNSKYRNETKKEFSIIEIKKITINNDGIFAKTLLNYEKVEKKRNGDSFYLYPIVNDELELITFDIGLRSMSY